LVHYLRDAEMQKNNKILVRTSVVDNGRVLSVDLSANDPCLGSAFVITLKKGEKIVLEKPITSRTERIANDTLVCASCDLIVSLPDNIRLPVESSDPVVVWFGPTILNTTGSNARIDLYWEIPSPTYKSHKVIAVPSKSTGDNISFVPGKGKHELAVTQPVGGASFVNLSCGMYDVKLNNGVKTVIKKSVNVLSSKTKVVFLATNESGIQLDFTQNHPCLPSRYHIELRNDSGTVLTEGWYNGSRVNLTNDFLCDPCHLIASVPDAAQGSVEPSDSLAVWFGEGELPATNLVIAPDVGFSSSHFGGKTSPSREGFLSKNG
uniref:IgGFc_binding domain-containing protein n=1 Tax=Echinostoma caproni TaxID=27848 RepID=A0A183B0I8_9TREM